MERSDPNKRIISHILMRISSHKLNSPAPLQDLNGTLSDDISIKQAINKPFFNFHPILVKLGEVAVHMPLNKTLMQP